MSASNPNGPVDPDRRMLARRFHDPRLRAECERLHTEMFEQLALASEGPVVHPGRKRRGRLIFGDDVGAR